MTHMQLHKLLYYAQGWCLASRDRPLFAEQLQAWIHGPVVAEVYRTFADYDGQPIAKHEAAADPALSVEDRAIIESIWLGYGKYSAWQLREMTHSEAPWREARRSLPDDAISRSPISEASIRAYFFGLHEKACKRVGTTAARLAESLEQARRGETTELDLSPTRP